MSTPFTPEKAQVLLSAELPSIKAEWPVTRSVIAAIPPDKVDYTPDPVTRSAIELAWHIVGAENRFLEAVIDGAFDLTPRPRPEDMRTAADVVAWYDERQPRLLERLGALPADALTRPIDFR
ncbi:MAG TPA: DinB family protein, partial [Vicinamibacteria bacterium]|nr:DinB family protein [Vicinamibacteria bacterium]